MGVQGQIVIIGFIAVIIGLLLAAALEIYNTISVFISPGI